ncbi:MAG TPA: DinB family protein [Dehalococcoidia bacterium]
MDPGERMAGIDAYTGGYEAIMAAVEGLTPAQLDRHPDGEWSVRQIIHHLADTEAFRVTRLRRLLTEDSAMILWFDEGEMARSLHYERPPEVSLSLFEAAVRSNLELIALMSEADWQRSGVHSEFGAFTMDDWLQRAVDHLPAHAEQIRATLAS